MTSLVRSTAAGTANTMTPSPSSTDSTAVAREARRGGRGAAPDGSCRVYGLGGGGMFGL